MEKVKSAVSEKQKNIPKISFVNNPDCGKNSRPNKTPSLAASKVPAVVGDINLFCVSCCRMTPQMESPAPVRISVTVRGIRLNHSTSRLPAPGWNKQARSSRSTLNKTETAAKSIKQHSTKDQRTLYQPIWIRKLK